ncbi:MAG: hypothetical protein R3245_09820, partial [Kiloniellales bacterium]|nr:hypothetical protein [Kiloniellales bacterium]
AAEPQGRKRISVFLDRPVAGEYLLEIHYERLLGSGQEALDAIYLPLISAAEVQRQRGMIALLSGQDLTLEPRQAERLTKVGENQLPAFIRNQIAETVAHTYKYSETAISLLVAAVKPERKQGRFDAQIDTLISLGEVALKGSASVKIDVKSGSLSELTLEVPSDVNVLSVTGPSLRSHEVRPETDNQVIDLAFTREMEGQFQIEVNYELIMEREAPETPVPTISVVKAEVEHGRIAVEALSAVEVQATKIEQLSNLDINELPRQLILKTTNPILLAFRYVNTRIPVKLALKITRHREIDVQVATIEGAHYKTLITSDGLAVTTARMILRNSRRQFLRLDLPLGSEVWSVFVDGKPEKPAFASEGDEASRSAVLIKMINSAKGFPVDIVYATPLSKIGEVGQISGSLPRPDIVVTHSRWDVFLPVGPNYTRPDSNMDLIADGIWANPREANAEFLARAGGDYQGQMGQPLKIIVPTRGIRFSFEKLYANQSEEDAEFSIRYSSAALNLASLFGSVLGVLLIWAGIVAIASNRLPLARQAVVSSIAGGTLLLAFTLGYLGTNLLPAAGAALLVPVLLILWWAIERLSNWRRLRQAA